MILSHYNNSQRCVCVFVRWLVLVCRCLLLRVRFFFVLLVFVAGGDVVDAVSVVVAICCIHEQCTHTSTTPYGTFIIHRLQPLLLSSISSSSLTSSPSTTWLDSVPLLSSRHMFVLLPPLDGTSVDILSLVLQQAVLCCYANTH